MRQSMGSTNLQKSHEKDKMIKPLFTYKELSPIVQMSVRTLSRLVANKKIPFVKFPTGAIRFIPEEIQAWIRKHQVKTS